MRLRSALKYVFGLLLALLLFWWVLRGADGAAIWAQLKQASLPGLLLATALNLGHNVFRVLRWGALLEPVRRGIPFRPMFSAVMLGYMTSWVVPGRLGELVRPALLSSRERLPLGPCLGSVVADRLLDGLAVVALFAVGAAITPLSGEAAQHAALIRGGSLALVGVIGIPLFVLLLASAGREKLERWIGGRGGVRAWLGRSLLAVSEGIEAFKRPAILARVVLHTAFAWLMIVGGTWVGVRACGADISVGAMLVVMPLLVLGIALPTPGGAGGYHAAMVFGLTGLFAVPEVVAVGASFVVHAMIVVPVVLVGAVLLVVDNISFNDLLRVGKEVGAMGRATAPTTDSRPLERLP